MQVLDCGYPTMQPSLVGVQFVKHVAKAGRKDQKICFLDLDMCERVSEQKKVGYPAGYEALRC